MITRRICLVLSVWAALFVTVWSADLAHATTTTVTINFTDRSGAAAPVPAGAAGLVYCYATPSYNLLGNASFSDNDTSVSLDYELDSSIIVDCQIAFNSNLFATDQPNYTFSATPSGSNTLAVALILKDASATISVLDPSGEAASLPSGSAVTVWCMTTTTPYRQLYGTFAAGETSGSVLLVSDWTYRCYADVSSASYASSRTSEFTASASFSGSKTVIVAPRSATLEMNLRNAVGDPLPVASGEWVAVACESSIVDFNLSQSLPSGSSTVAMAAPAGVAVTCTVGNRNGYQTPSAITVTAVADETTTLNFDFLPYEQGIELSLTDGTNPFILPSGSSLTISCSQQGPSGYYATTSVEVGASSARLGVPAGTYNCSLSSSDTLAVTPSYGTLTVTAGQDTDYAATVVYRDAEATISLLDVTGASFTVPAQGYGSVTCQTSGNSPVSFSKSLSPGDSAALVRVVSGLTLTCDANLYDNGVSPTLYYASSRTASFVASASSPHTASVTVAPLNAQLSVNLKDADGNLLPARAMEMVGVSCAAASVSFTASNTVFSGQSSVSISAPSGVPVTCTAATRMGYQPPVPVAVTSGANQTTDVDITYAPYPQKVQLNLSDGTGPFLLPTGKTISLSCFKPAPQSYYGTEAVQVGASTAQLALPSGQYSCSLTNISNDLLVNPTWQNVTVSANQTSNYNATVVHLNAQIAVALVDGAGNAFNLPSPGGSVSCQRSSGGQTRSAPIASGSNQGSVYVQASTTYTCTAPSREGYIASAPQTITVPSGETANITFTYTALAQNLTVNLQDKDGNPVAAPSGSAAVSCYQPGMGGPSYYRNFVAGTSSRTFAIPAGTYTCSVSNVAGYTALSSKSVTVAESQDATVAFTLFPLESSIVVNLKDAAGNDVPASGWVSVWCSASGDGYYFSFSGSFASGESSKSVSVIGGYSYRCSVSPFGNYGGSSFSVSVPAGESVSQNVTLLEKNATLRVTFVDKATREPKNIPAGTGSAYVSCYNDSGSGSASTTINEGENSGEMLTIPGDYRCWASVPGFNIPWSDKTTRTRAGETVEYQILVEQKDSTVTLNFKDNSGNALAVPANSQWPSVSCWGKDGGAWASLNIGETSRELEVVGGRTYSCEVYGFNGYVAGRVSVAAGVDSSQSVDVVMQALDAEITVALVTGSDSGAPYVVPDGVSASAYCYSDTYSNYGSIAAGSSSVTLKALGGKNYTCSAWVPGLATAPRAGEVAHNGTLSVSIPVINPGVTATIRLVDQDSNVVENAESVSVGAYSSTDEFYYGTSAPFANGVATLNLVANGSYNLYPWSTDYMQAIYGLIKAGSSYYLPTSYNEELLTPASGTIQKDITVKLADATIQVSAGSTQGWAEIRPKSEDASIERPGVGGSVTAGGVSIPVPGGEYDVSFWPNTNEALIPKSQTVALAAGESRSLTFDITQKDHDIDVTATAPAGAIGYYWCNAFTATGLTSYGWGAQFGEASTIGISGATPAWTIACQGYSDEGGKRYAGEASYTVTQGTTSGSASITLTEAGDLLQGKATGSSDAAITVAVNSDTTLTADQGTFSSGQTVTVQVDNKGNAPETSSIDPQEVYDFTATNDSQDPQTAQQDVTLQVAVEPDESVYSYTPNGGYKPAATTDVSESNQSLALFSFGAGKVRANSARLVSVTVPKAAFNSGVLVVAKSKGGGGATPTPTPVATATATPQPPAEASPPPQEAPLPGNPAQIAPSAPQGFKIAKGKSIGKKAAPMTATWSPSARATGYSLTITLGTKVVRTLTVQASNTPSATMPKLKKGLYTVTLRATNAAGSSVPVTLRLKV